MHAVRIELLVELVMRHVVSEDNEDIFQYWLRFEFGTGGNPHVHGLNYVCGNPTFELVVEDEHQRDALIKANYPGAEQFQTKAEAEATLAEFYSQHVRENTHAKMSKAIVSTTLSSRTSS